jgi:hypothetical protein
MTPEQRAAARAILEREIAELVAAREGGVDESSDSRSIPARE